MTEWETTKIKGDVKADAKEVDATYTEIMEAGIAAMQSEGEPLYEAGSADPVDERETFDPDRASEVLQNRGVEEAKREILGRLDDLEARLPRKVGEELKG